jgi:hypothetical protein
MPGALVSSVVEEYDLAFCYPGILNKGNLCGLAALRDFFFFFFFCQPCKRNKKSPRLMPLGSPSFRSKALLQKLSLFN